MPSVVQVQDALAAFHQVHHHLVVGVHQVHVELVDPRDLAGEHACLGVVVLLLVVDHLVEDDGLVLFGDFIAETSGESDFNDGAWGSGWSWKVKDMQLLTPAQCGKGSRK